VTATPARHGPEGINRGQVPGFVLFFVDAPEQAIYISGDTAFLAILFGMKGYLTSPAGALCRLRFCM
jgi:hypothetical protein